jgi:hypothetical protein
MVERLGFLGAFCDVQCVPIIFIVDFKKVNFLTLQTFRRIIENTAIIELFFNDKLLFFNQLKIDQFLKSKIKIN